MREWGIEARGERISHKRCPNDAGLGVVLMSYESTQLIEDDFGDGGGALVCSGAGFEVGDGAFEQDHAGGGGDGGAGGGGFAGIFESRRCAGGGAV